MFPLQCPSVYDRILPGDLSPTHVRCTYIEGHEARHSFETLKVVDDAERAELSARAVGGTMTDAPAEVVTLVTQILDGSHDDYLELLLRAGHDRKRSRRGVPGFGRASLS